ncbi:lysoplasmalogenase family protein [Tenacibaculum sp. C7A-26P2]|uniref:lysoplasmalogenase family protein n=1 Tax=Tenacibaculum sp. C7A-26P2 TaxID=3447504 RepID=UPI003F83A9DC
MSIKNELYMIMEEYGYTLLYLTISLLSFIFIDNDSTIELILKLLSILSLTFMYLNKTRIINYYYLLVLLFSMASDAFLIFSEDFLFIGSLPLIANRFLYIIIASKAIIQTKLKFLIFYLFLSLLVFIVIYTILKPYIQEIVEIFIVMGLSSVVMVLFSYINYLNKMNRRNKLYFIGLFLLVFADILMTFNNFIDYDIMYVFSYTFIYYIARYLICDSMIINLKKSTKG